MGKKCVDVVDPSGAKLFSYAIVLDGDNCLDAEFEEAALIFAECSGAVAADEIAQFQARCDSRFVETELLGAPPERLRRPKGTVFSLVKHKMNRASSRGHSVTAFTPRLKRS